MGLGRIRAHVYEISPVNGLAAPDGRVFLTRGFLDQLDAGRVTEAELASVIAHELGHVTHGHARRRMTDFAGQSVLRTVLAGAFGRIIPIVGPMLAGLVASALATSPASIGPTIGMIRPKAPASTVRSTLCPAKSVIRLRAWPWVTWPSSWAMTEASSASVTRPASSWSRNPRVRNTRPSGAARPLTGEIS